MNFRIPDTPSQVPAGVQTWVDRIRRTSLRARLIASAVAVAIAAFLAWRIFGGPTAHEIPPPPVQTTRVQTKDVEIVERTIGTVLANSTVQLTARVQGQLLKAYFVEGQRVHTGELLFQIDPRPYRATYDSAIASLAAAKVKDERARRLLAANAIAPQDADDARATYLEAKASAESARLNLEYTSIHSPIDGKTGPILVQPGNQVMASAGTNAVANTTTTSASTLVVITQIHPVKISFALPQADLPQILDRQRTHGLTATIDNHAATGAHREVPVNFVSNAVDKSTGTIELRATDVNADGRLIPGELVDVGVTLDALKGATVVPREAVNLGPNGHFVYVVKDGNALLREITVLYDGGNDVAIRGDVKPGDFVIADGQLRVVPGGPVKVVSPRSGPRPAKP